MALKHVISTSYQKSYGPELEDNAAENTEWRSFKAQGELAACAITNCVNSFHNKLLPYLHSYWKIKAVLNVVKQKVARIHFCVEIKPTSTMVIKNC